MSVQTTTTRPAGKSGGAAALGILVTLGIFVVVFMAFLVAPLLALLIAFLGYLALRPRQAKAEQPGVVGAPAPVSHGFGSGRQ